MKILSWLYNNKEWLFEGAGIVVVSAIIGTIVKKVCKREKQKNSETTIKQTNKGVNNTQIGIQNNFVSEEKKDE